MSVIGSERRRFWDENGFLIFSGFLEAADVFTIRDSYDQLWDDPESYVIVDDLYTHERRRSTAVGQDELWHNFKINDLYLSSPRVRNVVISEAIGMILEELLGDEPTVCNSLNFNKGSEQPDHLDTLYMTPISERGLVATWLALEDTHPEAGPLRYYPGSNNIPPYRFSTGQMHEVPEEIPRWQEYMADQVERLGLKEERLLAKTGDLFIWDAFLLHGGYEIREKERTRHSLVTHYWTQSDVETTPRDIRPGPGGWWINKPPQYLPEVEKEPTHS